MRVGDTLTETGCAMTEATTDRAAPMRMKLNRGSEVQDDVPHHLDPVWAVGTWAASTSYETLEG